MKHLNSHQKYIVTKVVLVCQGILGGARLDGQMLRQPAGEIDYPLAIDYIFPSYIPIIYALAH